MNKVLLIFLFSLGLLIASCGKDHVPSTAGDVNSTGIELCEDIENFILENFDGETVATVIRGKTGISAHAVNGGDDDGEDGDSEEGESGDSENGQSDDSGSGDAENGSSGSTQSGDSEEGQSGDSEEGQSGDSQEGQPGDSEEGQSGDSENGQSGDSEDEGNDDQNPNEGVERATVTLTDGTVLEIEACEVLNVIPREP